jgi:hypothetical protein
MGGHNISVWSMSCLLFTIHSAYAEVRRSALCLSCVLSTIVQTKTGFSIVGLLKCTARKFTNPTVCVCSLLC